MGSTRDLWRPRPFHTLHLAWEADHPELSSWLRSLSHAGIEALEDDLDAHGNAPEAWRALLRTAASLHQLESLPTPAPMPVRSRGVKARKRAQVAALHQVLAADLHADHTVVEWCAGRGHLGRGLAEATGCSALLLEMNPALCSPPRGHPELDGVRHIEMDVLSEAAASVIPPHAWLLGLHACGSLTDRLLDVAIERGLPRFCVAPCCLWKLQTGEHYLPRSDAGKAHDLRLDHAPLHLAMAGMEIVSPGRRASRFRAMAMRAAIDLLARERSGIDAYHGFKSLPRHWFRGPLRPLRDHVEEVWQLPVGGEADDEALLQRGIDRVWEVRAMGMVRAPFRRAIELWVNLDRALSMQEAGYTVDVGTFCAPATSPRNILLQARR